MSAIDRSVRALAPVTQLTSAHPPFDVRIFHKECRSLAAAGYPVTLVAPHDHDERRDDVRLLAVARARGRAGRFVMGSWRVLRQARRSGARVFHFHDPDLIFLGLWLKLRGARVIYDVHEEVSKQVLNKLWIPRRLRRPLAKLIHALEGFAANRFDAVVAATPAIAAQFPRARTVVVQNFPDLGEIRAERGEAYPNRRALAVYVGSIEAVRGIVEMVDALGRLPGELPLRLALAGKFWSPELRQRCEALTGWSRVDFLGWQSREEIAATLGQARIGLVLLHPRPNYLESYPVKLFEYMAAGIPVVASDFPLWRAIIAEAGCGLLVDPLDPAAIALAMRWLIEHPGEAREMGARGREAVVNRYNWEAESQKLLALYDSLAVSP